MYIILICTRRTNLNHFPKTSSNEFDHHFDETSSPATENQSRTFQSFNMQWKIKLAGISLFVCLQVHQESFKHVPMCDQNNPQKVDGGQCFWLVLNKNCF